MRTSCSLCLMRPKFVNGACEHSAHAMMPDPYEQDRASLRVIAAGVLYILIEDTYINSVIAANGNVRLATLTVEAQVQAL